MTLFFLIESLVVHLSKIKFTQLLELDNFNFAALGSSQLGLQKDIFLPDYFFNIWFHGSTSGWPYKNVGESGFGLPLSIKDYMKFSSSWRNALWQWRVNIGGHYTRLWIQSLYIFNINPFGQKITKSKHFRNSKNDTFVKNINVFVIVSNFRIKNESKHQNLSAIIYLWWMAIHIHVVQWNRDLTMTYITTMALRILQ